MIMCHEPLSLGNSAHWMLKVKQYIITCDNLNTF